MNDDQLDRLAVLEGVPRRPRARTTEQLIAQVERMKAAWLARQRDEDRAPPTSQRGPQ